MWKVNGLNSSVIDLIQVLAPKGFTLRELLGKSVTSPSRELNPFEETYLNQAL